MLSDRELAERVQQHDAVAFELLYDRYGEIIRRHIERIVRSDTVHPSEAASQDLVQEVFLRVWTRSEQWCGRGPFKAWLYRIATNLAYNHLRSVRRRREQPLRVRDIQEDEEGSDVPAWMIDDAALGPDAVAERVERREQIRRLVTDLPEGKREVLHLVHEMEMTIRDAAEELGVPEGTVKSRLYYARKHLQTEWEEC